MLMNLTDVFTSEGKVKSESFMYEPTELSYGGNCYEITEKSPIELVFENIGTGKIQLTGTWTLCLLIPCDRCLAPVKQKITLSFDRVILAPDEMANDQDSDEQSFMTGYEINVEAFARGECILNLPSKVLCDSDCQGICPICGKNLNEGSCNCDTFVPDPRMAAIKELFEANKEV